MTDYKPFVFRFGDYEVRESEFLLTRAGESLPVEPKAFRVLVFLLKHPGRLITKDEIVAAVWSETSVSDNSLTRSIATLRRLLGDDPREPRYISTVQTVGYRFLPPVTAIPVDPPPSANPAPSEDSISPTDSSPDKRALVSHPNRPRPRWQLAAALALTAVILFFAAFSLFRHFSRSSLRTGLASLGDRDTQSGRSTMKQRRLSANPEDTPITASVISPDGKLLAFTDSTGIYLRLVDTGETHLIQLPKGFDASPQCWFPDSVHLIVSSMTEPNAPPALWRLSVTGGAPRKLIQQGASPRVSPDATTIAFLKGPWDSEEVWLADADGSNPRKVADGKLTFFGPAAWAPDGKRFAVVRFSGESTVSQIEIHNLADGQSQVALSRPGLGPELGWLPSGKLIYAVHEEQPNQDDSNLWAISIDTPTRPATPVRLTSDHDTIGSMSVTSDGARISLLRYRSQADVYLSDVESTGKQGAVRLSPLRRFTLDERQDFPSSWTADSKAVLIVSNRDGPSHIFIQQFDQTQPQLFVGGKQDVWLPHVTPDGLGVFYLASPEVVGPTDNVRLMRTPLAGGASQLLLESPGIDNYQCARLPSTVCIYGRIDTQYYRFFVFDPTRGNQTEIAPARIEKALGLNNWNLSPDGKYLVTLKSLNPYEPPAISVFTLANSTARTVPVAGVKLITGIEWAADSKSIWAGGYMERGFWGARSGLVNIELSGRQQTVIEGLSPAIMGATQSPDGHRIAIGANTYRSNVWLLENF